MLTSIRSKRAKERMIKLIQRLERSFSMLRVWGVKVKVKVVNEKSGTMRVYVGGRYFRR